MPMFLRSLYVGTMTLYFVMTEPAPTATERRAQVEWVLRNLDGRVESPHLPTVE